MAITATYISATSFSVNGDQTAIFSAGRAVRGNNGVDGYSYGIVSTSSYVPAITTVTLYTVNGGLTSNLTDVLVGIVDVTTGSLPDHTHMGHGTGGVLTLSGTITHNSTTSKQGGTTNEYYHLTAAEYAELQAGYVTDSEMTTISGNIVSQIPTSHTELTDIGTNTHAQIDTHIGDATIHFTQAAISITESQISDLDKYTQSEVNALVAAASGTTNHSLLTNLDYASAGHTGFQPAGDYITEAEFTTYSGAIVAQIPSLSGYATESYVDTASGTLQSQITTNAGNISSNYTTLDNKIDTTSGTLQGQIDSLTVDHGELTGLLDDDHPQYALTDGTRNITGPQRFESNVVIDGDLMVSGTTFTANVEEVLIEDNTLVINYGEVGAGVTAGSAGIEIDRGSETNYRFVYDEVADHFEVGISGSEQAVATREDTPTDTYIAYWNAAQYRFDTVSGIAYTDIASTSYVDTQDATISGALHEEILTLQYTLSETSFFLHEELADVATYESILITPANGTENTEAVVISLGDGETLIESYITLSGTPNTTNIPAGAWTWHLYAEVSSLTGDNWMRAKWYKRNTSGTETYLFTQEKNLDVSGLNHYVINTTVSGITLDPTDRLVVKIYAETTSANHTFTLYYEGTDHYTYFNTPVITNVINIHNELLGLQGGQADEYYHWTASDYADRITTTQVNSLITTASGDIVSQIPSLSGYATESYVTTVSGNIVAQIITDHGALDGLTDDDHSAYLLASDATNRTTFATNWTDLTDGGDTTLHDHDGITENTAARHDRSHAITSTSDHTAGNWKVIYTNGNGEVVELALGTATQILTSNGASSAPTFEDAPAGGTLDNIVEDTTPQLGGDLDLNEHYIELTPDPSSDHTGSGDIAIMTVDANATGIGAALYLASDGHFEEADASADATMPCMALALETGTGSKKVLLKGFMRDDTWNWTPGGEIYLSTTTGALTQTSPTGSGDMVQIVGIATHANRIFFNPNYAYAEVE